MLKSIKTLGAAAVLAIAACGGGAPAEPPAPPVFNPAGTYDVNIAAQGMSLGGVLEILGSPDAGYTGSIDTDMGGASVDSIEVSGQIVSFFVPEANAMVELTFDGDAFSGSISGDMGDATITGTKREGG